MQIDAKQAVLGMARAMKWVREIGSNRGQAVEAILRSVHLEPGQPWCAAFVNWVGRAVMGTDWPLPMVGGCATLASAADKKGLLKNLPEPGAIFLIWSPSAGRFNHTGFLIMPATIGWHTVEGNTSPDGSPEGTGVFERVRELKESTKFIHWWVQEKRHV